ncbi:MAG: DNA mismatch endonuclease Vsr [Nitrospirota bacterium]|nr:DNA mismatch endonuclease Vsr [Nitrospirota bacterium]
MRNRWPTDPTTSARMKRVRQIATGPEQRVQAVIRTLGVRFSNSLRSLDGSPDFCSKKHRWAVFVHGCFWHGHAYCRYATVPQRNRTSWLAKIKGNKARDRRVTNTLRKSGYAVYVIWECQTHDPNRLRRRLVAFFTRQTHCTLRNLEVISKSKSGTLTQRRL